LAINNNRSGISPSTTIWSMFSVRSPTSARLGAALSAAPRAPAVERIATGARINRAADDAANLGVGTKLRTHARSMAMARRNVNDALRASEVASGGLGEINASVSIPGGLALPFARGGRRARRHALAQGDGGHHRDDRHRRTQQRQGDVQELLTATDALNRRGLVQTARDPLQGGEVDDHVVAHAAPDRHRHHTE
jgi:hypothetical protein